MEEPKAGCTQKDGVGSEKLKGVQSKKNGNVKEQLVEFGVE